MGRRNPLLFFSSLFLVRALTAIICDSYFVPDEQWQSLEIAHRIAFGYGFLTWEWFDGIRSFLFPAPFAVLYKLLQLLHLDCPLTLTLLPRFIMAAQLAFQDFLMFDIGGPRSLLLHLTLWGSSYFGVRTLSNSIETLLFLLLFRFKSPIFLVVLSFWIRPTSLFASIWFFDFWNGFTFRNFAIGVATVFGLTVFDAVFYASQSLPVPWFTPLRFLYFNFVKGYAVKFGSQPFLFYFYSCIPSLFLGLTPFLFNRRNLGHFIFAVANIAVLSLSAHKEIRYLAPILPFFVFALSEIVPDWMLYLNGALQLIVFVFLSQFHQIGQTRIMRYVAKNPAPTLFLLPCHSTPLTTAVHRNVTLRILACPPSGFSESAAFLADPRAFVRADSTLRGFARIVTYQVFEQALGGWLSAQGLTRALSLFNSFFPLDGVDSTRIVLYHGEAQ
jgi:phosphatidylinositol glycan class B